MELPWPSLLLLVVPPAAMFLLVLVHWLRGPREQAPDPGGETQDADPPSA